MTDWHSSCLSTWPVKTINTIPFSSAIESIWLFLWLLSMCENLSVEETRLFRVDQRKLIVQRCWDNCPMNNPSLSCDKISDFLIICSRVDQVMGFPWLLVLRKGTEKTDETTVTRETATYCLSLLVEMWVTVCEGSFSSSKTWHIYLPNSVPCWYCLLCVQGNVNNTFI